MSRLEELPLDISTTSLLPYIEPQDLDTFCYSSDQLEAWCSEPENIRRYLEMHKYDPENGLYWAVKKNSKVLAEYYIELGATNIDWVMGEAAYDGTIKMVKLLLDRGATDYKLAMGSAAWRGYSNIIRILLKRGANDHNYAMVSAAEGGHIEIMLLMINLGANEFDWAIEAAEDEGREDAVRILKQIKADSEIGEADSG